MAGHSKWANIQHRKGRQDKLRSKLFSKLAKDIAIASKIGGPDPDMNPRLRLAIANAKGQSMPKDNIKRAVDKGAGGDGADYEDIRYEGFGPGGIGFIVEASTDDQMGKIEYPLEVTDEDTMMEAAIEAGADDCESDEASDDQWDEYEPVHTIWTARDDLGAVSAELQKTFGDAKSVNLVWKGQNEIDSPDQAAAVVRLTDALEDVDDVSTVFHNFEMSEAAAATLAED